ncbi:MAG: YggS family pyridoxal phosphate-dependent enzyme [Calditrichaeota bacterium]|nr:YggS family pyridoxal phosphate-dependent enzyme [Calditrichota bacterium]
MAQLRDNIQLVQERIAAAAARCGKSPDDITLVAVSKTVAVEKINQAIELGIRHIGESRIQEARQKLPEITAPVTRHLIGHLQRNKVKYAVKLFDMIQSVDNLALAEELNARCAKLDLRMPILIEVNTSGEASKFGCQPEEALTLLKAIDRLPQLDTRGFMTIAVYSEDTARVRGCFKHLKRIFDEAQSLTLVNAHIDLLSMGMSSDYEVAIEEGANLVRVGSAIFGEREG